MRNMSIESYGRGSLLVGSASHPGEVHVVDFEGHGTDKVVCTCEAFIRGHMRPCRHLRAVTIPLV